MTKGIEMPNAQNSRPKGVVGLGIEIWLLVNGFSQTLTFPVRFASVAGTCICEF